ncbi:MAG: response regulator transcription factor [Lachnospiraceae bacterium]|nr:response regulator transcription factor [Lachnospiraceae bacterium]
MTENGKILIVDDEERMRKLLKDFLAKSRFEVLEAADGEQALDLFYEREQEIALIVLDVMMPGRDGYEVCHEIRAGGSKVPIIMLTAKSDERDELHGFSEGADEYISKPFSPRVLVARIEAILRRIRGDGEDAVLEAEGIRVDQAAHTVTIDGQDVELSFKEFELLVYFMNNRGIALSREKILSGVWDYDYFGDARTVDTHVKKLRSKMGKRGDAIRTVWGIGYKFEA